MKLIVTQDALRDLRQIDKYIGQDNPAAAVEFVGRLSNQFQRLSQFPNIGHRCDEIKPGYRRIAEGDYIIFFQKIDDEKLAILRVVHGRRDLSELDSPEV